MKSIILMIIFGALISSTKTAVPFVTGAVMDSRWVTDTIEIQSAAHLMLLRVPEYSKHHKEREQYEEGVFINYRTLASDSMSFFIHAGAMVGRPFLKEQKAAIDTLAANDSILSLRASINGRQIREVFYKKYGVTLYVTSFANQHPATVDTLCNSVVFQNRSVFPCAESTPEVENF